MMQQFAPILFHYIEHIQTCRDNDAAEQARSVVRQPGDRFGRLAIEFARPGDFKSHKITEMIVDRARRYIALAVAELRHVGHGQIQFAALPVRFEIAQDSRELKSNAKLARAIGAFAVRKAKNAADDLADASSDRVAALVEP